MCTSLKVEVRECCDLAENCVVPDLQPDIVNVWIRTLRSSPPVESACYELLSTEERERAARYRMGRPRTDFILTRGTLRSLVASYMGTTPHQVSFRYSEHGKPPLDGPIDGPTDGPSDLRFNVSHTNGLALMGFVRSRDIGIDVEKINPAPDVRNLRSVSFRFANVAFWRICRENERHAAFFRCWTRKEAYVKARGRDVVAVASI